LREASSMARAWIGLGSNLGDRLGHIKSALGMMVQVPKTELVRVSSVYDTEPVGKADQPRFLNAVAELETGLSPRALLAELRAIEDRCGRMRRDMWGPRTLDLDILVHGNVELATEELTVPHPRLADRAFVLVPLAEIAPTLVVPGLRKNARLLLKELGAVEVKVKRIGGPPTPVAPA
jgi:2-amino-4-hydroxy-6-hydroxymethyldihydropteridine diphosphokinase